MRGGVGEGKIKENPAPLLKGAGKGRSCFLILNFNISYMNLNIPSMPSQAEKESKYHEETIVNGIKISVGWDFGHNEYTICFPQIETAKEKDVPDTIIRFGDDENSPEFAKQVFKTAVEEAEKVTNAYDLYRAVSEKMGGLLEKNEKRYHEETTVNGIKIIVDWDSDYKKYLLHVSGFGKEETVRLLGEDPEFAKESFTSMAKEAKNINNSQDLYEKQDEIVMRDIVRKQEEDNRRREENWRREKEAMAAEREARDAIRKEQEKG